MEFVRSHKLALSVVAVLVLLVAAAAFVVGRQVAASFSPALTPKSVNAEDYAHPTGKTKAEAPVGPAETQAPTVPVNPISMIELEGSVDLTQVEISATEVYGAGRVTMNLNETGLANYEVAIADLKSKGSDFTYDSFVISEKEASRLIDLNVVKRHLALQNYGQVPEIIYYRIRAVGESVNFAPPVNNPGTVIADPDK